MRASNWRVCVCVCYGGCYFVERAHAHEEDEEEDEEEEEEEDVESIDRLGSLDRRRVPD
jgi:hypothetical protein